MGIFVVSVKGEPIHAFKEMKDTEQFILWYIKNRLDLTEYELINEVAFVTQYSKVVPPVA